MSDDGAETAQYRAGLRPSFAPDQPVLFLHGKCHSSIFSIASGYVRRGAARGIGQSLLEERPYRLRTVQIPGFCESVETRKHLARDPNSDIDRLVHPFHQSDPIKSVLRRLRIAGQASLFTKGCMRESAGSNFANAQLFSDSTIGPPLTAQLQCGSCPV